MSNAYDNASLIVTPNGYEAGTIFSLKPTDGSGDLSFTRSTVGMRRNSAGLWEECAINVPRLHYPVGGGCPSWLFEPERTNLIPTCNTFTGSMTKTTGIADSPIDNVTSVRITKTDAGAEYSVTSYVATIANSSNYAQSLYFKYDGYDIDSSLEFNNGGDFGVAFKANIEIRSTGITISSVQDCTAQIIAEANGWYRLEVSISTGTVTANSGSILIKGAGSNGASFLVCTSQLEAGSTATSPIITAGATVTRGADNAEKTGISSLIGQTEGTLFGTFTWDEGSSTDGSARSMCCVYADSNNYISMFRAANNVGGEIKKAGVTQGTFYTTNPVTFVKGETAKFALTYAENRFRFFLNGVEIGADNSGEVPACSILSLTGGVFGVFNTDLKLCELYTTALSDSEAINLTTI